VEITGTIGLSSATPLRLALETVPLDADQLSAMATKVIAISPES
jgi:hypothetical protein